MKFAFALFFVSLSASAESACRFIACGDYQMVGTPDQTLQIREAGGDQVSFSTTSSDGIANKVIFDFAADGSFVAQREGDATIRGLGRCMNKTCQVTIRPGEYEGVLWTQTLTLTPLVDGIVLTKVNNGSDGRTTQLSATYTKSN